MRAGFLEQPQLGKHQTQLQHFEIGSPTDDRTSCAN